MKAIYVKYGIELSLEENQIITLVVENPQVMSDMLRDIFRQINGEEGGWILSENDKIFPLEKTSVLLDNPLTADCNEKKILTKLYKELSEQAKISLYEDCTQVNSHIISFLEKLFATVPYHLEMELDVDVAALLKLYGVKVESDGADVLETLIDYLRAISSICNIHVVWILNLKQFLTEEQVDQLYEFCFYEKIYLINLEGQKNYALKQEKCVIIDKDLCVIDTSLN